MKKSKVVINLSAAYYVAGPTLGAEAETADEEKLPVSFCFRGDGKGRGGIQTGTETREGAAAWRKGYGGLPGGSALYETTGQEKVRHVFQQEVA